jgi:choline dehydrogenase-like flavoprotein
VSKSDSKGRGRSCRERQSSWRRAPGARPVRQPALNVLPSWPPAPWKQQSVYRFAQLPPATRLAYGRIMPPERSVARTAGRDKESAISVSSRDSKIDVLVVGSGLMGATVANLIRRAAPKATIAMVDGGPIVGPQPGLHLHDVDDSVLTSHGWKVVPGGLSSCVEPAKCGPGIPAGKTLSFVVTKQNGEAARATISLEPGLHDLSAFGEDDEGMPGAMLSWNTGGMGVHWSAVTPAPWGAEVPCDIPMEQWASDLAVAESVLHVHRNPFGELDTAVIIRALLNDVFKDVSIAGREVKPMPMALIPAEKGRLRRVGPSVIISAMSDGSDPGFTLLPSTQALRLDHDGQTVFGAELLSIQTGARWHVEACATVVCADAFRTPQLLYASEIRLPALGKFLNEHAFLGGRVLADPKSIGISFDELPDIRDGEWCLSAQWLPHSGRKQPFHGQFNDTRLNGSDGTSPRYAIGMSFYVPTEIREENRLVFSESESDATGMPRIIVQFARSKQDVELIKEGRDTQLRTAKRFGEFDPTSKSKLLPPGSSLHITGTVRMGAVDDGSSVCDPNMRVWGYQNLFVAGCGAIPTALVCNSTLAGTVTAVRAARSVAGLLVNHP